MREYKFSFISIFSVTLLICSFVGFLIIQKADYRSHQREYYRSRSAAYAISNAAMDQDSINDVNWYRTHGEELLNKAFRTSENGLNQNVIYTGDIPEIDAEFVVVFYRGDKPYIGKLDFKKDYGIYLKNYKGIDEIFEGETK